MKEQNAENNFEKVLAQKANGFRMNPSEKVWENVQAQISKERKRRVAAWWFSLTLVLLAGGIFYFVLNNHNTTPDKKNQQVAVLPEKNKPVVSSDAGVSTTSTDVVDNTLKSNELKTEVADVTEPSSTNNLGMVDGGMDAEKETQNNLMMSSGPVKNYSKDLMVDSMTNENATSTTTPHNSEDVTVHHHIGFYHRLSVVGQIAPLVSFRTLHSAGFNDSLVKIRNQNDQVFMGMSYAAALRYDLSKTITLSAGISYARTGEGISVSKTYSGYNDSTISGNPFVATDSLLQYGTDYLIVNRYNYLEFPVDMEVTFKSYKTNEFSFNVGAAYEMLKQVQSPFYTMPSDPQFPAFNNTSESETLRNQNIKIFGGLNYRNEISNHFIFTGGIQLNMMLLNLFPSSYPLNEKPYWGGIKGGLIYHF